MFKLETTPEEVGYAKKGLVNVVYSIYILFLVASMWGVIDSHNFNDIGIILSWIIGLLALAAGSLGFYYAYRSLLNKITGFNMNMLDIPVLISTIANILYVVILQEATQAWLPPTLFLAVLALASFFLLGRLLGKYYFLRHGILPGLSRLD